MIANPEEMEVVEANALAEAMDNILREFDQEHQFTAADICSHHKLKHGQGQVLK